MGMTYEQYWFGDPRIVKFYLKANDLRKRQENERLWLQGFYNFQAISTALSNIHLDGKQHAVNKYMEKPLDFGEKTEEEKKNEIKSARQDVIDHFTRMKEMWDKKKQKG